MSHESHDDSSVTATIAMSRLIRCLPVLLVMPLVVAAAGHDRGMPPLAPGPYPVACSNLAQDQEQIIRIGGSAEDFWEGNPQNGQGRYVSQILSAPGAAIGFDLAVPADGSLYPQFGGSRLAFVVLVCYPTSAENQRPDYVLPGGAVLPHMERPGDLPIFPGVTTVHPLIVYSHSLGSSPLAGNHLGSILRLASHGYITMAVFHGDSRVTSLRIEDLGDLLYLLRNYDRVVELQALRPLALKAALDDLLARPGYGDRADAEEIGAFGASLGGEAALLTMGAWLTINLGLESRPTVQDPRIKAAVGYVPYAGQRLLPAFGDDQNGAQHVRRPFLAICGSADATAPQTMAEQAVNRMQGSRFLVSLAGVEHKYLPEYADDVFGWAIPFLDAYVRDDPAALARFEGTREIDAGLRDSLVIAKAVPPVPRTGLWAVDAEVDGSPGRGFQLDARNGTLVLTFYGYEPGGRGRFWQAAGPYANAAFTGPLVAYDDGTPFGGSVRQAHAASDAGGVSLSLVTAKHGTIELPGEGPKAVSRFAFGGGRSESSVAPRSGLWAVTAEVDGAPGRGFQIDLRGNVLVITFFGYDEHGNGTFWLAAGSYSGNAFRGPLVAYEAGTAFGGPFQPARQAAVAGEVVLSFSSDSTGSITLPGEAPRAISLFDF
jgi:predicted dienelactone hydrolase